MKKLLFIGLFYAVIQTDVLSQNVGINISGSAPNSSAGLDVDFTSKGLLIPRLALTQTSSASPVTSPATSLVVYNTASVNDVTPGFYYWNGTLWIRILNGGSPANAWLTTGNAGTTFGTHFIGTTDAQGLDFRTNNVIRMSILSGGNVGIGTTTPAVNFEVSASDVNTAINIVNTNSTANRFPRLNIYQYGTNGSAVLELHHANGTSSAPSATLVNDVLGTIDFDGYSGTAFFDGIKIQCIASENWTGAAQGNYLSISGIANGSTALTERIRMTGNGFVGINNTNPTMMLDVAGSSITAGDAVIRGVSTGNGITYGVQGTNSSATNQAAGMYGLASGNAVVHGVLGIISTATAANASGVRGYAIATTGATFGVWGENGSSSGIGVFGNATNGGTGVQGSSNGTYAMYGVNTAASGYGTYGVCTGANGNGVVGICNNGATAYGVWGRSTTGYSGYFDGPGLGVNIVGNLNVTGTVSKGGGSFKIDHPLDPENKYLYHSFVESPDMINIYNGNIITDDRGEAEVNLPSYFQTANTEYKYQLTVIGQFAQAIVLSEIENNKFMIKTDKPNVKVSWQVTGVRNDKWAQQYRIPNEVEKSSGEKGKYLYPELYGYGTDRSVEKIKTPIE